MQMRTEELKRILQHNPMNADIIENESRKLRTTQHHKNLINFINNYHYRAFNQIAKSVGKPEDYMMICNRIFRVSKRKIDHQKPGAQTAYDNIQEINKALYYLHCNFYYNKNF